MQLNIVHNLIQAARRSYRQVDSAIHTKVGSNKLDMYKSNNMKYKVKDSTFRDIYARDTEVEDKPRWVVILAPKIIIGLTLFFALFFIPLIFSAIGRTNLFFALIILYLFPLMGWLRLGLLIGLCYGFHYFGIKFANRYWESQHSMAGDELRKKFKDDSRIQQPEELPEHYGINPDMGAHTRGTAPTALLGHIMFTNAGVNPIYIPIRADGKTDKDADGNLLNKHVLFYDEHDNIAKEKVNFIDEDFGEELWDSAGIPRPHGKNAGYIKDVLRHRYDPDKLEAHSMDPHKDTVDGTVADRINKDWYMPDYEVQRPSGAYIVDTEPNNTMILAMTRAGKGQTYIEPMIDCWLRSDIQSNIVCNDPKGELYLKFYYMARKRGYRVVSFNLMEPSRTDIYNPLGYAVEAARKGNNQKVEEYVKTIGDVFFPPDKADDPMWPNAANAAFQRSALGLIDFYMEEDREIRHKAQITGWSTSQLNRALDKSWGHVTLYNVYQMMTQLASKKSKDANFIHLDQDDPSDEKDYLTLFFDATAKLPPNALRTSVKNQDNSLRAMAGSDKTIASVYGISLTAIKFFADDKISRLTSGRPSQNFDIIGMSFPRRIEIKIDSKYARDESLRTQGYKWEVYSDSGFNHSLGKVFEFQNNVDPDGWILYVTKGIFPKDTVYLKLSVFEQRTKLPIHTWYFKFTKDYKKSLDNRNYVIDPVSEKRVVKDGYLVEVHPQSRTIVKNGKKVVQHRVVQHDSLLPRKRVSLLEGAGSKPGTVGDVERYNALLFEQIQVHYTEEPTSVFFITPPHLKSYARIVLILINQMFNMQVDKSYLTLDSQKPFYDTKYMLDEVGNLSSDGSGIPDLQTKESIGLAQGQYFTLILQTLQQLKDVYGDSIDKILQGNTGNVIYIKSTDDSMLEILQNLSGKKHKIETDSQTVSDDKFKIYTKIDGKVSNNITAKEVPVISKNDMLQVPKANMMVFGKGNPIWNHNQLAMPYAFKSVHENALKDFNDPQTYNLRTVPTTANTMDFDILNNQPNFINMVVKRVQQAKLTSQKTKLYRSNNKINGHMLTDDDLSRMDPEALAKELMLSINEQIAFQNKVGSSEDADSTPFNENDIQSTDEIRKSAAANAETNTDVIQAERQQDALAESSSKGIYGNNQISKHDLLYDATDDVKDVLGAAYISLIDEFKNDPDFQVDNGGSLIVGGQVMIKGTSEMINSTKKQFGEDAGNTLDGLLANDSADTSSSDSSGKNVDQQLDDASQVEVQAAWLNYLAQLPNWNSILKGKYDAKVGQLWKDMESTDDNDN